MHAITKTIAVTLTVSLLGQTSLLAQIQGPAVSLDLLQEQAKKSELSLREKGLIIGGTVTSAALLFSIQRIVQYQITLKNKDVLIRTLQAEKAQAARGATQTPLQAVAPVTETETQRSLAAAERTINSFKRQREYYEYLIDSKDKALEKANQLMAKQHTAAQQYVLGSVSLNKHEAEFVEKCADFLSETSPQEQAALKKYIFKDRMFTRLSPTEQAKFRTALEELSHAIRANQPLGAETYQALGRMILLNHQLPPTQRLLRGIGNALVQKSSKAVLPLAILTVAVMSEQMAQAAPHDATAEANRILHNVDLLLEANSQQIQEMQATPEKLQAAVMVASVLQDLDNASEEELSIIKQEIARQRIHAVLQPHHTPAR